MSRHRHPYDGIKRAVDVWVSTLFLVLTLPIIAAVALVVLLAHGRPVLFRQVRPGHHGQPFELVKFRTMRDVDVSRGHVTDGERLTAAGRFLRATSLDELPTLWNVVRGHMSLVGPRPLLMKYLDLYTPEQARRHDVRPGITGLAQVRGRNAISWEEKFRYDVQYVDERSAGLDIRILAETITKVLRRDGITSNGEPTAAEFTGSQPSLLLTGAGSDRVLGGHE